MADYQYSPELLELVRRMQDVAAKDPGAANLVKQIDPELVNASNGLWKPNTPPPGTDLNMPMAFTDGEHAGDQRYYQQELAKAVGVPGSKLTIADLWALKQQQGNQQPQAVASLNEDE